MKKFKNMRCPSDIKKTMIIIFIIFTFSVIIGSFIYIDKNLRPPIKALAETKSVEYANRSINKSVANMFVDKVNYNDLMNVKMDSNGKITMIQANTIKMNEIASAVALNAQDELKKTKNSSFKLPIGTALKSPLLAKYGPKLNVSIDPIGAVTVNFKTEFESSGINQTIHRIYLEAKTQVRVVIPLTTSTKEVVAQIPICETVIVGDVPESYINIPDKNVSDIIPNVTYKKAK